MLRILWMCIYHFGPISSWDQHECQTLIWICMKLYRTSPSRRHGTTSPCEYTVNQLLRPTRRPSRLTWKESTCLRNYIQRRLKQAQMNFAKTICDQCIQRPPMVSDNTSSYSSEFKRSRSHPNNPDSMISHLREYEIQEPFGLVVWNQMNKMSEYQKYMFCYVKHALFLGKCFKGWFLISLYKFNNR